MNHELGQHFFRHEYGRLVAMLSGAPTIIGDDMTGKDPSLGGAIALDGSHERALVIGNRLISVNLETNVRTVLSGPEPGPTVPTGVTQYSSPCCALIVDDGLDALLLVDLVTGERVILSGHD